MFNFKPTSSCRRRLLPLYSDRSQKVISIHSLYAEGDILTDRQRYFMMGFQSTPSMKRETWKAEKTRKSLQFQSTPSMQRETCKLISPSNTTIISIHSLYAEGDKISSQHVRRAISYFNPLPLCRGRP